MVRPTTDAIQRLITENYIQVDDLGRYIPKAAAQDLADELMQKFSGISCAIVPDRRYGMLFHVQSSKTRRTFFKMQIRDSYHDE